MIIRILPAAAAFALLSLTACGQSAPEEVDSRAPDPMAEQLKNAAPVELPPAVAATATFRCKDNSLIYVDFFHGEKTANLRTEKGGTPTAMTAPAAGQPYTGGGYTVSGNPQAIELTAPGKAAQSCKA